MIEYLIRCDDEDLETKTNTKENSGKTIFRDIRIREYGGLCIDLPLEFMILYILSDRNEEEEDEDETKERKMSRDELVKGALESAFWAMDRLILRDKQQYRISGGACTMVALFIFDKLYLANAGDSRAVCYLPNVGYL